MNDEYETLKTTIEAIKKLDGDRRQEEYIKELRAFHKELPHKNTPKSKLRLRAQLHAAFERLLLNYDEGKSQQTLKECANALNIANAFYA